MNCSNCGTPLVPGNNTCPECGALNMPLAAPATAPAAPEAAPAPAPAAPVETAPVEQASTVQPEISSPASVQTQVQSTQEMTEDFEELDTFNENQVAETAAAPTLELENEVLETQATDIGNAASEATYDPTEVKEESKEAIQKKVNDVSLNIPSANEGVVQVSQDVQNGGIQSFDTGTPEIKDDIVVQTKEKVFKIGNKKIKMTLSKGYLKNVFIMAICVVGGVMIGYVMFSNTTTTRCLPRVTASNKLVADGKNNVVLVGGYTYNIPEDYTYDTSSGGLIVYDKEATYKFYTKTFVGDYESLANAQTSIIQSLADAEIAATEFKEMILNEHKYILIPVSIGLSNRVIAFTDAGNNSIHYIELITSEGKFNNGEDKNLLTIVDDIVYNATLTDTKDVGALERVPIKDLSVLIKTVAESFAQASN